MSYATFTLYKQGVAVRFSPKFLTTPHLQQLDVIGQWIADALAKGYAASPPLQAKAAELELCCMNAIQAAQAALIVTQQATNHEQSDLIVLLQDRLQNLEDQLDRWERRTKYLTLPDEAVDLDDDDPSE